MTYVTLGTINPRSLTLARILLNQELSFQLMDIEPEISQGDIIIKVCLGLQDIKNIQPDHMYVLDSFTGENTFVQNPEAKIWYLSLTPDTSLHEAADIVISRVKEVNPELSSDSRENTTL